MLEVIRLCATKTAANVRAAKRLAAIHRIRCQTVVPKASTNEGVKNTTTTPENAIVTDPAEQQPSQARKCDRKRPRTHADA